MEFYEAVDGYIATECPTCGTRLVFRPERAGGTLKCEMCYRQLPLPAEIKVRPKRATIQPQAEPYALREEEPPPAASEPRRADEALIDKDSDPPEDRRKDSDSTTERRVVSPPQGARMPCGSLDESVLPVPEGARSAGYGVATPEEPPGQRRAPPRAAEPLGGAGSTSRPAADQDDDPPRRRKEAFAVHCAECGNRMWARLHQVGQEIACGTCGAVMVVPPGPTDEASGAKAPQKLLLSPPPSSSPSAESPPSHASPRGQESPKTAPRPPAASADPEATDAWRRTTGGPASAWHTEPPTWTFFSGVVSFLWIGAGPLYWGILTGGLIITFWIGVAALSWMGEITPGYGGIGAAMITMFLIAAFGPILALALSHGASCFLAVMRDTANGARDIVDWPQLPFSERVLDLSRVVFLAALSLGLSYIAGLAAVPMLGDDALPFALIVGAWLLFPLATISSLESQRTIWPFSAVVLGSLFSLWWGWLIMYLELAVLLAIWGATVVFTFESSPYLTVLWSSPVLAAVALIAARLFGRLIWRATVQDADDQPPRPTVFERVVRSGE